jgi:hypothetical protein
MMKAVGKDSGRFIIASGKGVNKGRLAAGAPGVENYLDGPFSDRVQRQAHGDRPGGLIDKKQQINPELTVFAHPFDSGKYRGSATNALQPPKTFWDVINYYNPLTQNVPEIAPHEKGKFFRQKVTPIVKSVFGANQVGKRSDTAFHPSNNVVVMKPPVANTAIATEKMVNRMRPPSFESMGNLWNSANHSFIDGHPNTVAGQVGVGRWHTIKRSVV